MGHSWQEWVFINESNAVIGVQGWKLFGLPWRTGVDTPSSGTVRFTPECTNVPQPRCTEVPNSSGLRYSVPGTPWFTERYVELRCSEGKKRFSRQFATRHCTALYLTLYLTTEHCTPTSTCVVLHLQVECKAPLNSAENWNVHFSKKEIRHCPAGEPAGFS